jgi:thioesterase domain-containing protein
VIAFEVAKQLTASGVDVLGLILIDSPNPETTTPISDYVLDAVFSTKGSPSRAIELVRSCMRFTTAALVAYDPYSAPTRGLLPKKAVMLRSREAFHTKDFNPLSQSDAFLADRADPSKMVRVWEKILGYQIPVLDIPGNHFEVFDPRYVSMHYKQFCTITDPAAAA